MFKSRITVATLHYVAYSKNDYGSMEEISVIDKVERVNKIDLFSAYYYNNLGRDMRKSLNLQIVRFLINDVTDNGLIHKLERVTYNDILYKVVNINEDKTQDRVMLLELEELE